MKQYIAAVNIYRSKHGSQRKPRNKIRSFLFALTSQEEKYKLK